MLNYQGRLCVSNVDGLSNLILWQANRCHYSIHPGSIKMYHELSEVWEGMKRDIAEFVAKCQNCKEVKAKHKKKSALLQEIQVPTWKLKDNDMDFLVDLP